MKPVRSLYTTFLTSGTRGDVQPVIALALGLQAAGKPVKIAAPPAFGAFIQSYGAPFAPVDGNPSDLMTLPGGQSALTLDGNLIRNLRASLAFMRQAQPLYAQMLASAAHACFDSSALVIGLPTLWGTHLAEALSIPCFGAFLQPVTPTRAFPAPVLPFSPRLGAFYNRFSYHLAALAVWLPWRAVINRWRAKNGLARRLLFDFTRNLQNLSYGFSPLVVPPPDDWPPNVRAVGYWTLPIGTRALDHSLEHFLQCGAPPIYISFGSPGVRSPDETARIVLEALARVGLRAVFSMPRGVSRVQLPETVFPLETAVPHDAFLPRTSAIVHHGGAGTSAAGLLAGIPALACPLAVDQFFWAGRIHALGVGPKPLPQRELTVALLADRFAALQDDQMKQNARQLAEKLALENGVAAFVNQ